MDHKHIFDKDGICEICSQNMKVYKKANADIISFAFLISGILFDYVFHFPWFQGWLRLVWYLAAYLPVGYPVLKDALKSISRGNFFSEFFLMGIATIGAFAIGE